jgi:PAS domain S-box-containing protein
MSPSDMTRTSPQSAPALVAAASGASVAALGGLVIAGWLTVAMALIQVFPGFPPMQYNTALGFMICGAGLLTAALNLRRPTAMLGVLAALIGSATLFQYLFHSDLGIDQFLLETYLVTGVAEPGRMGPNSAFALTLVGFGLLSLAWRPPYRQWHVGPALIGSIVIALGIAALMGYIGDVPGAYGWSPHKPMAIHSAIGFTLLGGGIVGLAWNAAESSAREAPAWIALTAAAVVATVTLCLWYALSSGGGAALAPGVPVSAPASTLSSVTLATGLLTAVLLGWSVREGQISRRRARSLEVANLALNEEIRTRIGMQQAIQQLAALVESSDDAILATTLDGQIMTWNPGAERLYGYTRAEAVGKPVSMLHGRSYDDVRLFRRLVSGERVSRLELVNVTKDGRRIDVSLTVSPIRDQTGSIVSASTIAHDITDRKLLEQMKDDFVGTVSHELRTPLTAIKGFIELVADGEAGPVLDTQREFLQVAARNVDKLGVLINDLIDMNLIESHRLEVRRGPVDLAAVLADVASTFRVLARSKGLEFRTDIGPVPSIRGDAARLVQVFSNLVSNAIKYTPEGEVGIRALTSDRGVEVAVYDTGIGLSPEEHARLFTRFFRGQSSVVTEAGGTGLGLVIVKAIVERHHGQIRVESTPGEGTCFRVTLPLETPDTNAPPGKRSV